jgi:sec-independent protein translocase protein TatB
MLDFGFSEILLTSAIALVVLGPERLPKVARQVGNWMGRARLMARQLSEQLEREVNAEALLKENARPRLAADPAPLPPDAALPAPVAETAPSEAVPEPHPTSAAAMHPTSAAAMHPVTPTPSSVDPQQTAQ